MKKTVSKTPCRNHMTPAGRFRGTTCVCRRGNRPCHVRPRAVREAIRQYCRGYNLKLLIAISAQR